ncbi:MAG: hypothetical protein HY903_01900 [Deltaproteobacteria bacterium]|nr:hypothetical protein [Deltaproteobacteria bacterium]
MITALVLACSADRSFVATPCVGGTERTLHVDIPLPQPLDILFVVDNSAGMAGEIDELRARLDVFGYGAFDRAVDVQVGVITTDVECNSPTKDCGGTTSESCCAANPDPCMDRDLDDDGVIDTSDCDGGRLRASGTGRRVFPVRGPADWDRWRGELDDLFARIPASGSAYPAGLEALRRAVGCSSGLDCDLADSAVGDLNGGFIRPDARLVVLFVSDQDDCSSFDRQIYGQPADPADLTEQSRHLCSPAECYSSYGAALDTDGDGLMDWADPDAAGPFTCGGLPRATNPPSLDPPGVYVDRLVATKGDPSKVVMAVMGGVVSEERGQPEPLATACVAAGGDSSADCGCWSKTSDPFYCLLTNLPGSARTGIRPTARRVDATRCLRGDTWRYSGDSRTSAQPPVFLPAEGAPRRACAAKPLGCCFLRTPPLLSGGAAATGSR